MNRESGHKRKSSFPIPKAKKKKDKLTLKNSLNATFGDKSKHITYNPSHNYSNVGAENIENKESDVNNPENSNNPKNSMNPQSSNNVQNSNNPTNSNNTVADIDEFDEDIDIQSVAPAENEENKKEETEMDPEGSSDKKEEEEKEGAPAPPLESDDVENEIDKLLNRISTLYADSLLHTTNTQRPQTLSILLADHEYKQNIFTKSAISDETGLEALHDSLTDALDALRDRIEDDYHDFEHALIEHERLQDMDGMGGGMNTIGSNMIGGNMIGGNMFGTFGGGNMMNFSGNNNISMNTNNGIKGLTFVDCRVTFSREIQHYVNYNTIRWRMGDGAEFVFDQKTHTLYSKEAVIKDRHGIVATLESLKINIKFF